MDLNEYIESGLLEGYLLHALSPEEMKQVEQDVATSKDLQKALEQLEFEMEQMAYVLEKKPDDAVWDKIDLSIETASQKVITEVTEESQKTKESDIEVPESANVHLISSTKVQNLASSLWKNWAIAASISTLVFLSLWRIAESDKTGMKSELQLVKEQLQKTTEEKTYFASMQEKLISPDYNTIALGSAKEGMGYQAKVMWNKSSGEVMVATLTVPELTKDQDLQLWALVDGKPVNAGVITMNSEKLTMQTMKVDKADMFAVTVEPKGGRPEPTLTELILIGKTQP